VATLAGNFVRALGRAVHSAVQGNDLGVDAATLETRLATCKGCVYRRGAWCANPPLGCGCLVTAKVRLATEACPRGRW
jgi:hypothetical protein